MDAPGLKSAIEAEIDAHSEELRDLSQKIHANPELAFHEFKAAESLTDFLEESGFSVERRICGLETAFRGSFGKGAPVIAVLAEYDALPALGHACGHNLIAASAVGAGLAAKIAVRELGGQVQVIGTPGEEMYAGKAIMTEKGAFSDVDMSMMVHPGITNTALVHSLACQGLKVEFFGKAAHAAARPEEGINALEAIIQSFVSINSLRQHIKDEARIHGIITHGGEAANVVPSYAAADFIVRAEQDSYLDELKDKVLKCFLGASMATNARLEYRWGTDCYATMLNNLTMARLFSFNMKQLGREMNSEDARLNFGSTDMGNVSRLVPSIHPIVSIAKPGINVHSPEFAQASASEEGVRGLLDGAKALAMTIVDILSSRKTAEKIKEEFELNS